MISLQITTMGEPSSSSLEESHCREYLTWALERNLPQQSRVTMKRMVQQRECQNHLQSRQHEQPCRTSVVTGPHLRASDSAPECESLPSSCPSNLGASCSSSRLSPRHRRQAVGSKSGHDMKGHRCRGSPGALPCAISAASIRKVPEPHMGSASTAPCRYHSWPRVVAVQHNRFRRQCLDIVWSAGECRRVNEVFIVLQMLSLSAEREA